MDPDSVDPWGASLLSPFFGPRAVIMVGGERHRRDRKLLTPPFHGSRMRAYGRIIIAVTREQTRGWGAGWEGPVHATTTAISLDVIVRAVFGIDTPGRRERASSIVKKDVESIVPLIAFLPALRREFFGIGPWSRFARARRELDALLYGEITSRRANASGASETGEDILSLILAARYDDGTAMTDDEVHDQLITLLAAGHETTATALAWALYWTHRDPRPRITAPRRDCGPGPYSEPDAIAGLPLLDATCTETLRLHPIVHDVSRRRRPADSRPLRAPRGDRGGGDDFLRHARKRQGVLEPHGLRRQALRRQQAADVRVRPLRRRFPPMPCQRSPPTR